jgi:hypothetical protein
VKPARERILRLGFDPHHPTTHHKDDPESWRISPRSTRFVSLFAYYLDKLKSTRDGNGSLPDHSVVLYGSGMAIPTCMIT